MVEHVSPTSISLRVLVNISAYVPVDLNRNFARTAVMTANQTHVGLAPVSMEKIVTFVNVQQVGKVSRALHFFLESPYCFLVKFRGSLYTIPGMWK